MQEVAQLEGKAWAASAPVQISLDTLPKGKRVRSILLHLCLSGTKGETDAEAAETFALAVQNIRLGEFVNISGIDLYHLLWELYGRQVMQGTDIPGSGATFSINVVLELPFRDPRQPGSDDGSIPTELLYGKALEVTFAAEDVYGDDIEITSGTLYTCAEIVAETNVPQLARILSIAPNSQHQELDPGIYKSLILTKGTGATISEAEVTTVKLDADGKDVLHNIRNEQMTHLWNARGAQQSAADAEQQENAAYFLPLIFHDKSGKSNLTKQVLIEGKGGFDIIAGTLTSYHLVIWKTVGKDEGAVATIAAKIGAPDDSSAYEPHTASKTGGRGVAENAERAGRVTRKLRGMYAHLGGKFRKYSRTSTKTVQNLPTQG